MALAIEKEEKTSPLPEESLRLQKSGILKDRRLIYG